MTEIWEKFPEVYHYTSAEGLQGILKSQMLFATRYDCLNDRSELRLLREALPGLLEPTVKKWVLKRWQENSAQKRRIRNLGGVRKVSENTAAGFATIHFDAAFGGDPAITVPYVTSFCGHPNKDTYEREHGLLSQWRAYGGDGGFALVFDTERLWQHCLKERQAYAYAGIIFDDVVYKGAGNTFPRELRPTIELIRSEVSEYLRSGTIRMSGDKERVAKILSSFARLKHRGFREEKEVRIVACPITPERYPLMAAEFDEVQNVPVKNPRDGSAARPQIELFDFKGAGQLPITRIIVGPQVDQISAVKLAECLVGGTSIKVAASETPLIQQHAQCIQPT